MSDVIGTPEHEQHIANIKKLVQRYFDTNGLNGYCEDVLNGDAYNWDLFIWFEEKKP